MVYDATTMARTLRLYSVTQAEALKNLLQLRLCVFTFVFLYAIIAAFIAYSHAYTLLFFLHRNLYTFEDVATTAYMLLAPNLKPRHT